MFLQEIWLPFSDSKLLQTDFPNYNFQISTPDMFLNPEDKIANHGQVWHGAAVAWHNDLHSKVTQLEAVHERFTVVKIALAIVNIFAISLYAPTSGKEFLECLSYLSDFLSNNRTKNDVVIIGADSNCSPRSTPRRKSAFSDFCTNFSIKIQSNHIPTFHHNNLTSESCIDYFLTSESESLQLGKIKQLCTLDNPQNLSSHDPLVLSLLVPIPSGEEYQTKYTKTYTDFNRKKIVWDKSRVQQYQNLAGEALSGALEFWNHPAAIPMLCTLFSQLLVKCAEMTFETKSAQIKAPGYKMSKNLHNAEKNLKQSYRKWKAVGKPRLSSNPSRKSFIQARSNFQRTRRAEENLKSIKDNNALMHANINDKNKVYAKMKSLRKEKSNSTTKLITPVGE